MVKLYENGVYLLNGTEIVEHAEEVKAKTGQELSPAEAAKNTMAYHILEEHNTSGNMERCSKLLVMNTKIEYLAMLIICIIREIIFILMDLLILSLT